MLRDVDEHIYSGTRVAVVGETGSGKTTFAKLLTRLMDPTTGAVLLDGVDVRAVEFASLRRRVVLVPQEGFLFDSTLLANARYGDLDATPDQVRAAAGRAGARRLARRRCRTASTPGSASAASCCPRVSASWSPCSAPTSPTPTCSSSTRRPAPSTRRWRCGSPAPWRP